MKINTLKELDSRIQYLFLQVVDEIQEEYHVHVLNKQENAQTFQFIQYTCIVRFSKFPYLGIKSGI